MTIMENDLDSQGGKKPTITPELRQAVDRFLRENYVPPMEREESLFDLRKSTEEDNGIPKSRIDLEVGKPVLSDIEEWTDIENVVRHVGETFQQMLFRLIKKKGMDEVDVYQKAQIDRKTFSKIRRNSDYKPRKRTVLALALALHLNLDETKDLLSRAEQALSPGSKGDLIVEYCIRNGIYDLFEVNALLYDYGEPTLP